MNEQQIETIEIHLLLEAIYQRYGYDFRCYAKASIKRRVNNFLKKSGFTRISDLTMMLLRDESFFEELLRNFAVSVTEMFRDPGFYQAIRKEIILYLETYPFIKIWHAGCATGEEAYSLAILLKEEGLYDRATIFATDIYDDVLSNAREGIYSLEQMKKYTENYQKAGGRRSFSDYYHARYDSAIMDKSLAKNITFAKHNLVTDSVFGEMHLILCRNVLIYFDTSLQEQVLRLFNDSLIHGGFLCLGSKESLHFTDVHLNFKQINERAKIYRKKS